MSIHSIQRKDFDVIALETKHQADYERSLKQEKFSQAYTDDNPSDFFDGKWDGLLSFQPEAYQWLNPLYRKGYLAGVSEKFDEQFAK